MFSGLQALDEALSELTETERRIVIQYLKTRFQPKRLAESLNVSVRTVYKALYKYRKALRKRGIDPSELYLAKKSSDSAGPVAGEVALDTEKIRDIVKEIVEEHLEKLGILGVEESSGTEKQAADSIETYLNKVEEVIYLLKEINRNIQELRRELSSIAKPIRTEGIKQKVGVGEDSYQLPSFIENNPWLEVLSLRKT